MKIIGYTRVSTPGQKEDGVSLEAQEAKIRAWANLNDHMQVDIFSDPGVSGKRADNRPGLQAAMAAARRGDAMVIYSLSRLSRSVLDTLTISADLQKRGIDLVSISDKIDTTSAAGKLYFTMTAAFNQFFRDIISEQTCCALDFKRSKGEKLGGRVPFGYDALDGMLFPRQEEQAVITDMLAMRKAGLSLRDICADLESRKVPTRLGSPWQAMTVRNIVKAAEARGM